MIWRERYVKKRNCHGKGFKVSRDKRPAREKQTCPADAERSVRKIMVRAGHLQGGCRNLVLYNRQKETQLGIEPGSEWRGLEREISFWF